MAYKIDLTFQDASALTSVNNNSTLSVSGGVYDLSITALVGGGNGSYHTAGFALAAEDQVYFKFSITNTASAQTSLNMGFVRNASTVTSQGYSLVIASGVIGGTSFGASGAFQDRAVSPDVEYWIKYIFRASGNIEAYLKGGAFTDYVGVRDMAAGITTGTIRPQIDAIGIAPNDGTDHLYITRLVAAPDGDPDPSVGTPGGAPANSNWSIDSVSGTGLALYRKRKGE